MRDKVPFILCNVMQCKVSVSIDLEILQSVLIQCGGKIDNITRLKMEFDKQLPLLLAYMSLYHQVQCIL